jgi:hypothetical protein
MTETNLFVSSCSRRELARRRGHAGRLIAVSRVSHPGLASLVFLVVCALAFIAGRGGL